MGKTDIQAIYLVAFVEIDLAMYYPIISLISENKNMVNIIQALQYLIYRYSHLGVKNSLNNFL